MLLVLYYQDFKFKWYQQVFILLITHYSITELEAGVL